MSAVRPERRWRLLPRSLLGRMLLLTLLVVLLAQGLSSIIWVAQLRASQLQGLRASASSLAHSMSASVSYFRSLPVAYRPMVLDQLRSMGGTRFFVSLNAKPLDMPVLPITPRKQAVIDVFQQVLHERLGSQMDISVEFVAPDDLRIFNSGLKLDELPRSWAHYSLTLEPLNPPVLVTQIRLGEGEWLYIASLLPEPYTSLEAERLPRQQIGFIVLTTALLLLFIGLLVHWQSWPLKRLARAAREMSLGADVAPVAEGGGSEVVEVSRAFNSMRERISRYLTERSQLFSAISHDLRTPITRLRLRAESLTDPQDQQRFGRDIAEMDAMITATLDYLRGVAHAESMALVDVAALVHSLADDHQDMGHDVAVQGHAAPLPVQAGALRRCLDNLVGNAVRYGGAAELALHDGPEQLRITVRDHGPGLPDAELARVMAPFYRVEASRNRDSGGVGLGLTIAQDIVRRHGGQLRLSNAPGGGLLAEVLLPRSPAEALGG